MKSGQETTTERSHGVAACRDGAARCGAMARPGQCYQESVTDLQAATAAIAGAVATILGAIAQAIRRRRSRDPAAPDQEPPRLESQGHTTTALIESARSSALLTAEIARTSALVTTKIDELDDLRRELKIGLQRLRSATSRSEAIALRLERAAQAFERPGTDPQPRIAGAVPRQLPAGTRPGSAGEPPEDG